jgi:nitrile hydratase alpha subunit
MSEAHSTDGHDHQTGGLSPYALRVQALETLLEEKGVLTRDEVRQSIEMVESRSPTDGARVVARAWVDPRFKARLLSDPRAALAEMGYAIPNDPGLVVLEDTEEVHHLVVCTLCSCYPRALLGRPPDWYKSLAYRSRAVVDPRGVIQEFGLELPQDIEVRVVDSTADMRYMVLPQRPPGTERLSEEELARLVTRDSLIGVGKPRSP